MLLCVSAVYIGRKIWAVDVHENIPGYDQTWRQYGEYKEQEEDKIITACQNA